MDEYENSASIFERLQMFYENQSYAVCTKLSFAVAYTIYRLVLLSLHYTSQRRKVSGGKSAHLDNSVTTESV